MNNEIKYLFPTAVNMVDYMLQDNSDGNGAFIAHWGETKLGERPTSKQLADVSVIANTPTYQQLRAAEYAKMNQFEMQYNDAKNGTTTWIDWQVAIKLAIPKL
jgi:hypothetical protein